MRKQHGEVVKQQEAQLANLLEQHSASLTATLNRVRSEALRSAHDSASLILAPGVSALKGPQQATSSPKLSRRQTQQLQQQLERQRERVCYLKREHTNARSRLRYELFQSMFGELLPLHLAKVCGPCSPVRECC